MTPPTPTCAWLKDVADETNMDPEVMYVVEMSDGSTCDVMAADDAEAMRKARGEDNAMSAAACQKHEPDWTSLHIESDGGTFYLDLKCKNCGCGGCLGTSETFANSVNWEEEAGPGLPETFLTSPDCSGRVHVNSRGEACLTESQMAENQEWSGHPDPSDPDNYWIDDATGERVNAKTGERTKV